MEAAPERSDDVTRLMASQRRYYDLRADDYADVTRPTDRKQRGLIAAETARGLVDDLRPEGDVLEMACGPGGFTRELARHARSLTAVDGSPRMLARNREAVGAPHVEYVCADLFSWTPARRFDLVFFGFWLSHVPPALADDFWELVRSCLRPGGRAAFEDVRAQAFEAAHTDDGVPIARRTLGDGRTFDIVKVFWEPAALEDALRARGWDARVRPVGDAHLHGVARPPG